MDGVLTLIPDSLLNWQCLMTHLDVFDNYSAVLTVLSYSVLIGIWRGKGPSNILKLFDHTDPYIVSPEFWTSFCGRNHS